MRRARTGVLKSMRVSEAGAWASRAREAAAWADGEMVWPCHDRGRLDGSLERARIHRRDRIAVEARRETLGLRASVGAERHVGGSGEPILGAECGLAVSDQQQPRRHAA